MDLFSQPGLDLARQRQGNDSSEYLSEDPFCLYWTFLWGDESKHQH
jgi:hypothetical protein